MREKPRLILSGGEIVAPNSSGVFQLRRQLPQL
jgi:hypothetical protein